MEIGQIQQVMDNPQVIKALDSRSKWLSKAFHFLEYDDLMQDGRKCVLEVLNKYPDAEKNFIFKAINNTYSNILERALVRVKHISNFPIPDPLSEDIMPTINPTSELDLGIDRQNLLTRLVKNKDPDKALIYSLICDVGMSAKEIHKMIGIPRTTVYRKIREIKEMID